MANTNQKTRILLQGGTLLLHGKDNHVVPTVADLLIEGQHIAKIGQGIASPDPNTRIIDCKGKIISPGFIDTHRHLYQTQNKGDHGNHTLIEYMPRGNFIAGFWNTTDLFWGELAGALESIDAGTTTVVDHSSCNTTADHSQVAIQALLSSGLRAVYCYTPARRVISEDPYKIEDDFFSESNVATFKALAKAGPFGNGRVHVGYGMDNIYAPADVIKPFYAMLRDASTGRAKVITTHTAGGPLQGFPPVSAAQIMASHGLLGPDILFSHANWPKEGDGKLYQESGAMVSCTPNTELQMGRAPIGLREDHYRNASIGVDCHSWGVSGIPGQMRLLLQWARAEKGENLTKEGKWPIRTGFNPETVFNLGTLGGAKAAGLQDEIGTLKEGFKADILIFESETPAMLVAAEENPLVAIVMHSSPSDISTVIVDGVIRKAEGKLLDVAVIGAPDESKSLVPAGTKLGWIDVAKKVKESRLSLKERTKNVNMESGETFCMDMFYISRSNMVDERDLGQ